MSDWIKKWVLCLCGLGLSLGLWGQCPSPPDVDLDPNDNIASKTNDTIILCGGYRTLNLINNDVTPTLTYLVSIDWGDGSPPFNFPGTNTTFSHNYTTEGFYDVTVTSFDPMFNPCPNPNVTTLKVYVGRRPNADIFAIDPLDVCAPATIRFLPSPITLNNSPGTEYTVSISGVPVQTFTQDDLLNGTVDTISVDFNLSSCGQTTPGGENNAFDFRLLAVNPCGRDAVIREPILVSTRPIADFTIEPPDLPCTDSCWSFTDVSLVQEVINGPGGANICLTELPRNWFVTPGVQGVDWTICSGSLIPGSRTVEIAFLTPGNYQVGMIITSNNCSFTDTVIQSLPPIEEPPTADAIALPQGTNCVPATVEYINLSTGDFDNLNWNVRKLNPGGGAPPTETPDLPNPGDLTVVYNSWGTYEVSLSLGGVCGSSVWRDTIVIADEPLVNLFSLPDFCDTADLDFTTGGKSFDDRGSPITAYLWEFTPDGIPLTSNLRDPTAIYVTPGNKRINLSATNACGTGMDSEAFDIIASPILTLPNDTVFCQNDPPFVFTATASDPSGTGVWSGIGIAPDGTFTPANAGIGLRTLTYTYTLGPCVVSEDFIVEVFALPEIVFDNPPTIVCEDLDSLQINLLSPPTPLGGTWGISAGGFITADGVFLPAQSGPGLYQISYETPPDPVTGCINRDSFPIRVVSLPVVNVNDTLVCDAPELVILVGSPTMGGTGLWSDDGSGRIVNPIAGTFDAFGGTADSPFKVFYTFTDNNGCVNLDSALVSVGPPPLVDAGPDTNFCVDDPPYDLNSQVTTPGGVWNGIGITGGSIFNPPLAGVGTFPLIYTVGTGNCASRDTIRITVNPLPNIVFLSPNRVCASVDSLQLLALPGGGTWTALDGAVIVNGDILLPSQTGPGTYSISYRTGPNANGCRNTGVFFIEIQPLPLVVVSDQTICDRVSTLQPGSPQPGLWNGPGIIDPANGIFDPAEAALVTGMAPPYTVFYSHQDPFTGCLNTDSALVDVVPVPVVDLGPNDTVCIDQGLFTITGFTPTGGTWMGPGIVDPVGIFDPTIGEGNYVVTYTFSAPGVTDCQVSESKIISVIDVTGADAGPDTSLCLADNPIALLGTPAGGTFTGQGVIGNVANGFQFDPGLAGVGLQVITYTVTDASGNCFSTDDRVIRVNAMPESNFESDTFACINIDQVQFINTSALLGPTVTPFWEFGDGGTSTDRDPRYTYTVAGTYDVKLTMATAEGCTDSITKPILIEGPPIASFDFVPPVVCAQSEAVTFTNTSVGFETNYQWNFGNGDLSTEENPPPVVYDGGTQDTTYEVTLFAQNVCGNDLDRQIVQVRAFPNAQFTGVPDSGCSPFNVVFTNFSTPDDPTTTYTWDFGNGNVSLDRNPPPQRYETADTRDSVFATLVVRNTCGSDTADQLIKVDPPDVQPRFTVPNPVGCTPHTIQVFNQAFPPSANVFWDWGDGTTSSDPDPGTHTYTRPGTFTIRQTVSNSCGSAFITELIVVNPTPSVSFSFANLPCALDPVRFINEANGANSFIWDFGDGGESFERDPIHTYTQGGIYTVTLIAFDSVTGCPNSFSQDIEVRPAPSVDFTIDNFNGCAPVLSNFTNQSDGDYFFRWDFGDGNTSVETNPTHIYTVPGIYTVTLTAIDEFGCDDQQTFSPVSVIDVPRADFTFDPDRQCELPVTLQFTNQTVGGDGYRWTFEPGAFSTAVNPIHTYQTAGDKVITLIATNSFQCQDTIEKPFLATPSPMADFSWDPGEGCQPLTVNFQQESVNATDFFWDFGDGNRAIGDSVQNTYRDPGDYTVTLVADFQGVCQDTLVIPDLISVFPGPVANFTFNQLSAPNGRPSGTFEFFNLSVGAVAYNWDFGDGTTSTETNPVHTYDSNGEKLVTLEAISSNDCRDTITLSVFPELITTLYIPNVFTPQGTGDEEVRMFKPKGIGLSSYQIEVFNRYGQRIWRSTAIVDGAPSEAWDGTVGGELVDQGTYVWRASATFLDGTSWKGMEDGKGGFKRQGSVNVVR